MATKTFRVNMDKAGKLTTTDTYGHSTDEQPTEPNNNTIFYVLVKDNKIVDMKRNSTDLQKTNQKEFTDAQIEAYMKNLSVNTLSTNNITEPEDSDLYDKEEDIGDSDAEDTGPTTEEPPTIKELIEKELREIFSS